MPRVILVVDDEEDLRRILQISLEHAGYETIAADDGRQALACVAATPPDLIILDVMMPGLSGFQVLEQLKQNEATSTIPVVMLTAAAGYEDMQKGWEKGSDLYLTKPTNPAQIVEYVKAILED